MRSFVMWSGIPERAELCVRFVWNPCASMRLASPPITNKYTFMRRRYTNRYSLVGQVQTGAGPVTFLVEVAMPIGELPPTIVSCWLSPR